MDYKKEIINMIRLLEDNNCLRFVYKLIKNMASERMKDPTKNSSGGESRQGDTIRSPEHEDAAGKGVA